MGKVYLVGGGPGNRDLITWKGIQVIRKADCILYDRLIDPALLEETNENCERIYVGKENHHHTMKQQEIQELMVKKAREYEYVVRLKGGDVYVFGRGGEEGSYLREHGIEFEVIPGVSSCIAGLAYAGIPITHRGIAGGFHVLTAHDMRDDLADIDFHSLAISGETCVFLMGLSKTEEIMRKLIEAGMPEHTKAAVIAHAASPEQKTVVGTIGNISYLAGQAELSSPALIVVGEVIALRERLNFFEEKALFGRRYLLPRIGKGESFLSEQLREYGAAVREIQMGQIQISVERMEEFYPEDYSWIVMTSKNGVTAFWEGIKRYRIDHRRLSGLKFAVVGKATEEYLSSFGIFADLVPEYYDTYALLEKLSDVLTQQDHVCAVLAEGEGQELCRHLKTICSVDMYDLYRNEQMEDKKIREDEREDILSGEYDAVVFTCSSAAKRMRDRLEQQMPEEKKTLLKRWGDFVSIGEKTSETLKETFGVDTVEAKEASYAGIIQTLLNIHGR